MTAQKSVDFDDLVKILEGLQQPNERRSMAALDMLLKIFVGIATAVMAAGMIWLVSSVSDVQRQVAIIVVQQANQEKIVERFDDYNAQTMLLAQTVRNNETLLTNRAIILDELKTKITAVSNEVRNLQDDVNGRTRQMERKYD